MAKQISGANKIGIDVDGDGIPDVSLSLKTISAIAFGIISMAGMWFTLKADIELAKELPTPTIERIEYDLKDELIRQTIMDTQEDVDNILNKLDKLEERLYEITKDL
jgi:hypothetical protein